MDVLKILKISEKLTKSLMANASFHPNLPLSWKRRWAPALKCGQECKQNMTCGKRDKKRLKETGKIEESCGKGNHIVSAYPKS